MKLVITKFKSGSIHEKHVVATWNIKKTYNKTKLFCIKLVNC